MSNTPVDVIRNGVCSSASLTPVGVSASSVTLLSENKERRGFTITNTSSAILYLRYDGATADAATGHSVPIAASGGYFEDPYGFTGTITGIWASDAGGSANVTEFTA